MEIGPNLTSVLLPLITLGGVVFTGVMTYLGNRKAKALDAKVVAVDTKMQFVADGMRTQLDDAQAKASIGVGKAAQVAEERIGERARAKERLLAVDESARAQGVEQGRAEGIEQGVAEEKARASSFMPLEP
jgi:hypothetical protein